MQEDSLKTITPIAVVCALDCELAHLRLSFAPSREEWRANRRFWLTELGGKPIVLNVCGMGMLSAAAATELIIDAYRPAVVLNYGCAGAHRVDLLPGDLVVGERVVAYDSTREDALGNARFAGMRFLRRGEEHREAFLPVDPDLLATAIRTATQLDGKLEPWPPGNGWPDGVPPRAPRLIMGTVASADRWNRSPTTITHLVEQHGSHCEDMEAAAIALVCVSHDVPFLAIKDISNNELLRTTKSGTALVGDVGDDQLGRRAAAVVREIIGQLADTGR